MDFCLVSKETRQIDGEANSSIFAVDWKHLDFKSKQEHQTRNQLVFAAQVCPIAFLAWGGTNKKTRELSIERGGKINQSRCTVRCTTIWNRETQSYRLGDQGERYRNIVGAVKKDLRRLEDFIVIVHCTTTSRSGLLRHTTMKVTNKDNIKNASQVLKQHKSTI